jgi:hypothetical protein
MDSSGTLGRAALRFGVLLIAMLLTACAGFKPFEPRNDRVEGPEQGLFSGEAGEFVIWRKDSESIDHQED